VADQGEEWELSNLRYKAEEAVSMLADAVAGTRDEGSDLELRQQLSQLNLPNQSARRAESLKPKSNLHAPHPPNLPLALLKLMDAYVLGLAEVPMERGGWSEAKRERALGVTKALAQHMSQAECLSASMSMYSSSMDTYADATQIPRHYLLHSTCLIFSLSTSLPCLAPSSASSQAGLSSSSLSSRDGVYSVWKRS